MRECLRERIGRLVGQESEGSRERFWVNTEDLGNIEDYSENCGRILGKSKDFEGVLGLCLGRSLGLL